MSVNVMTWVWQKSRSKKNARLLLLAIADCANDAGLNAFPSVTELMRKTGLSERGVQSTIAELVKLGELRVRRNAGPGGCNRYQVVMVTPAESAGAETAPPAGSAPADAAPPQKTTPTPAESAPGTVLEPSEKKISSSKRSSEPRGHRLPEPYDITEPMRDWVRTECPDVRQPEHDRFCDYWRGQPGAKGRKTDWFATWRNWMRRAQDDITARKDRTNGRKPSTTDARVAEGLALAERFERMEISA